MARFGKAINTIRARIDYFQITKRTRGGANNVKGDLTPELLDDVIKMGVNKAAVKHGLKGPVLYHRLYYKHGLSVKMLKEKAKQALKEEEKDDNGEGDEGRTPGTENG